MILYSTSWFLKSCLWVTILCVAGVRPVSPAVCNFLSCAENWAENCKQNTLHVAWVCILACGEREMSILLCNHHYEDAATWNQFFPVIFGTLEIMVGCIYHGSIATDHVYWIYGWPYRNSSFLHISLPPLRPPLSGLLAVFSWLSLLRKLKLHWGSEQAGMFLWVLRDLLREDYPHLSSPDLFPGDPWDQLWA